MYEEIVASLREGRRVTLATIISSTGSIPVPAGAKMMMREGAAIPLGTVGGGCVEAEILEASRQLQASGGRFLIRRFTLTEDDIESGMLCGGTLDILIEMLEEHQAGLYETLLSRREAGSDTAVITVVGHTQTILGKFLISGSPQAPEKDEGDMPALREVAGKLPDFFYEIVHTAIGRENVVRLPCACGELIVEPVASLQDLIIFGGGHVSRYVSRSAAMAGFRVTIVDDRPEYANRQRFPEAYRTLAVWFDAAWDQLHVTPSTSIVIVTRGHKFDESVLERAIHTPARYVGMIGSKRKVLSTFTNIVNRGTNHERLRNVYAPIGLSIGALTAEEIGISICGELIAVRRGAMSSAALMSDRVVNFFDEESRGTPRAGETSDGG